LDRAREHDAEHDPDRSREVAELGGEHRTHERPGAGDGREVVAEEDPPRGRHEVAAVLQPLGGCGAAVVEFEHALGEKAAIEAVGDEVGPDGGEDEPGGADSLAAVEGDGAPRDGAGQGEAQPGEDRQGHTG
jgi:hypothetical protein